MRWCLWSLIFVVGFGPGCTDTCETLEQEYIDLFRHNNTMLDDPVDRFDGEYRVQAQKLEDNNCSFPKLGLRPIKCSTKYVVDCPKGYACQCIQRPSGNREARCNMVQGLEAVCVPGHGGDLGPPDRSVLNDFELVPKKEGPVYLDNATVKPPGNCLDSADEPNNSGATATMLKASSSLIPGWEICYKGDVDQFAVNLTSGQQLSVRVVFTHSKGDLDAALVEPGGQVVDISRSSTDHEQLSWTATSAGKHIFGVWGVNATNTYDLQLTVK